MIRETQLNFELTACAAHRRGNRISGTKAPYLVLEAVRGQRRRRSRTAAKAFVGPSR
jgi:hypothetical protein